MSQIGSFGSGGGGGGVASVTAGTGINLTGTATNPIINLDVPVTIAHGGTNSTSYSTVDGTLYYDGTQFITTATGTAGQVLTSGGVGVAPAYATLPSSGFTWTVTTVNASLVANNGYIANKAGLLTMTLPASGSIGDTIEITGINTAVGWRIAQNANQQIFFWY